ncbi:NB-ARC domain-containing protein [Mastigocoleus testarum BC008]|uniref:NB-ARC domain-containing protein n=2 Tax=Mastigocoleus TaxID=996924 RepID=A0A0V7ZCQ6_9CYAN|nr:NB-ARC domain-containing protein [Mastigocoleus testarum BC008]
MGGIGKTELALQYALRYQDNYPGGLCWLQVRGKDLGVQIIDFGRRYLGVNPPDYLELDLEGQVKYCWSHWKEGAALIVLDDVPKYGNFYRENILPYLPPTQSRFKVLMTSRQRPERGIRGIDLDVLSPEAALELLKVLAGSERIEVEIEAAQGLCKWLGYLPLALELVGRYLDNHPTLTLAKVLSRLESKRLAARALLQQEYGNMTAPLGVAAAFELSWVELDEEAQKLGCLLSLFASAPFNWELVEQCLPDTDEEDLEDIRDGYLLKFNLLQLTSQKTYRIHPLVREFLQAKLAQLESALQLKHSFAGVMTAISTKCIAGGIGKKIPETPTSKHIDSVKDAIPHLTEVAENLTSAISDEDLGWVFIGLGKFYQGQGLYRLAEPWYGKYVELIKSRCGENDPKYATSLAWLAFLYEIQGRYSEAEPLYEKGLEMRKQLFERDHPNVASSLNNLALLYYRQGRYSEAEPLYEEGLEMAKRLFEGDHPDVAASLDNLALLYERQRRYSEAEPLYEQAFEMTKRLFGGDHPDVATSLNNLAFIYDSQGRYSEAEPLYKQALEMRKRLFEGDHPDVALSLNNLAALYSAQGRYSEAELLYEEGLEMRKRLFEEDHPDVAVSLDNLAFMYSAQGRYSKAEPLYKQALEIRKRVLGEQHPDVVINLNNLALLYYRQRRYSEAEVLYEEGLEKGKWVLGDDHSNVATSLNNLANLYSSQGRYSEAKPLLQQALELYKRLFGDEHPWVATSLNNLAALYYRQGRYGEAQPLYERALEICKKWLGTEHPNTINVRNNLEYLRRKQKRNRKE